MIDFTKMQGIGNDYVYIDARAGDLPDESRLAIAMSNRNFGIGSDGLILIKKSRVPGARHRMHMYNSDGSESEMCGNGIRCVGKWLYDRGIETARQFPIETGAGILVVDIRELDAQGKASKIRINMGQPRLLREEIPMAGEPARDRVVSVDHEAAGAKWKITAVSMGNPHCVVFVPDTSKFDLPVIGPKFEHHPLFPRRTNTEFVQVISRTRVKQRTWERGAGETLACGTGASAVCVAGVLNGLTERRITIELLGGELELEWNEADNCVYKTGPAVEVFNGKWLA